ncbi:MAG TPA: exosortase/archaeosortase family protein [Verrucomicrobia bacterium]|nr:exosortase/archaeosortase family protein [Verrucomicrobiota bacterium]HOB31245.1 exosortase/archaeosortase family protein [Verrucomicrobiota bacterium]HOP97400.1 exosortase/archaeosortase family protein [Verrucomicrobiota bacterium]HPU57090.1 exosortase/archaeosortase family protein [Verrucomicrobiota bacterium]
MQSENQATLSNVGVLDEFQTELVEFWRRLPNKAFFFTLLAAWLALFQFVGNPVMGYVKTSSLYAWMMEAYTSPNPVAENDRHGPLIPFLVLGLMWWKRRELMSVPPRVWPPALIVVVGALALHSVAYVAQQPHFSIVALFAGIYGLMGLAWGWHWMIRSFFPFILFVFSVPLGNRSDFITVPLRHLVSWLVEKVCSYGLGIDVIRMGNLLFDPTGSYQYEIAAACSGIRSLVVIFLISTLYAFVFFRSPWRRLVMIALAVPMAVLGNLLRMLCIVIAAAIGGQEWGNAVHDGSISSLLPYVPAIMGVFIVGRYLEDMEARAMATAPASSGAPAEPRDSGKAGI